QARDFNLDIIRADRFDLLDFIQVFESYPMMAEIRLVVLRDVHDLTADQCRGLERILESEVETARLIAVGHKIDMRRKIFRQLAKLGRAVEFRPPYDNQVPQWIQRYAKRAGIAIEPAAIQLLSQYVGAKPRELVSEIEKLVSFAGTPIKAEAVEQVAGITRGASVFDLADAVGKGQGALAHKLMMGFIDQGEEPTRAVAMMTRHFQLLIKARDMLARSLSREEMAAQLGVAPFFLNGYLDQARNRPAPWLWAGLSALQEADWRLKSQGRRSEQLVLDLLIARLCTASSRWR
ncbi:MAG: DNA polymerase III subunit delta, partial [Candidatus Latescibacteria bacterium]|nr:DNA polymerase III subunit delta [Candidatus Latescibacterota bacterium]